MSCSPPWPAGIMGSSGGGAALGSASDGAATCSAKLPRSAAPAAKTSACKANVSQLHAAGPPNKCTIPSARWFASRQADSAASAQASNGTAAAAAGGCPFATDDDKALQASSVNETRSSVWRVSQWASLSASPAAAAAAVNFCEASAQSLWAARNAGSAKAASSSISAIRPFATNARAPAQAPHSSLPSSSWPHCSCRRRASWKPCCASARSCAMQRRSSCGSEGDSPS
mmetsp:Transcript_52552/g.137840  ORF Transcript_52552/g.137840 Transcript_52552/m.137840 type:complete len:229 (-) Transcript_52552:296-982(-)